MKVKTLADVECWQTLDGSVDGDEHLFAFTLCLVEAQEHSTDDGPDQRLCGRVWRLRQPFAKTLQMLNNLVAVASDTTSFGGMMKKWRRICGGGRGISINIWLPIVYLIYSFT